MLICSDNSPLPPNPASQQTVIPVYPLAPAADTQKHIFSHHQRKLIPTETEQKCFVSILSDLSMRFLQRHQVPPPPFAQEGVTNPGNPGLRKSNQAWLINTCFKQGENQCMKCLAIGDQLSCHSFFLFLCHEGNNDFLWVSFEFVVTQFGTNVHRPPSREAARHFLLNKSTRRRHERWRRISPINNPGSIRFKPPSLVFFVFNYLFLHFINMMRACAARGWSNIQFGQRVLFSSKSRPICGSQTDSLPQTITNVIEGILESM